MAVIVEALDGGLLDGSVHPLDLSIGSEVLHLNESMFDAVLSAEPVEEVLEGVSVPSAVGKLNAVVGRMV